MDTLGWAGQRRAIATFFFFFFFSFCLFFFNFKGYKEQPLDLRVNKVVGYKVVGRVWDGVEVGVGVGMGGAWRGEGSRQEGGGWVRL